MSPLVLALIVGLGGAFGAVTRYLLSTAISSRSKSSFPLATLLINITGAFAAGLGTGLNLLPTWVAIILVGFLGGYTTFGTAMLESVQLAKDVNRARSMLHLFGMALGAILACYLGLFIGHGIT